MSQLEEIYKKICDDLEVPTVKKEKSDVCQFYSGKTLFITGVSGFIGKCLLEKLLRSCSGIKRIYILMREKQNQTLEARLKKYFQNEVFHPLRNRNPNFEKKVTAIKGDLNLDDMGISKEDRDILIKETNIIFHNAANVKFTERVNVVLKVNVIGTKNIIDLAEECRNLEVFMYVSSAYSHIYRKEIKEKFYQPAADLSTIYKMIDADEKSKNGLREESIKSWIGDQFNTYTFSKAASEELIRQRLKKAKFACGVFRPSIVVGTVKEPVTGWIGNANGPTLCIIAGLLGVFHTFINNDACMDMVPCDYAVNALITATWDLPSRWAREQKPVIYNYGSSTENPTSIKEWYFNGRKHLPKETSTRAVWMHFAVLTKNYWIFMVLHILFHFIPACIADAVLFLTRRKPLAVKGFWKATRNLDKLLFLAFGDWKIYMPETLKVINRLNSTDKKIFDCEIRKLDWDAYIVKAWRGIRYYILKETLNSKKSERRYNLLWYAHYGLLTTIILGFSYYALRLIMYISPARNFNISKYLLSSSSY